MKREGQRSSLRERLEAMPLTAARQLVLAVLEGATLVEIEAEVVRDVGDEADDPGLGDRRAGAREAAAALAERGDAPGLGVLFEQVADDVDPSWSDVASSLSALAEAEANAELGAIAILIASSPWADLASKAPSDRLGRLALAAVAAKRARESEAERPAALELLRAEAARFFAALHGPSTDTGALAAVVLIRARDVEAIAALTEAVRANPPSAASARALVDLIGPAPDAAFEAPLEAFAAHGFGRARS